MNYRLNTNVLATKKSNHLFVASVFVINALLSNVANAQGVAAGIDIANKVVVTYSIDNKVQEPIESSPTGNKLPGLGNGVATVFKVDRKVDLTVTASGDTKVKPGDTRAELNFTIKNDGNDAQEFLLVADSTLTTDNFDTSNCKVEITAVTGTPLAGVILPTVDKIKLAQDQEASVRVQCDIPFDKNGQPIRVDDTSLLSLKATAVKNGDGSDTSQNTTEEQANIIDTVFADTAGTDDQERDAAHSAQANYIALASTVEEPPSLTIDKAIVEVKDPDGGSKAVSGSEVTYKIAISTAGKGIIKDVIITDPTPAGMTYKENTMTLDGNNLSDTIDADMGNFNTTNNISTINLGDISAGSQFEVQLTYTINN